MRINNGLDGFALTDIRVNLKFTNALGLSVIATSDSSNTEASFFIRQDGLSGINAIDGTGTIAPKTSGEIRWLIIPAPGAGGSTPEGVIYFVGGELTYTLQGEIKTIPVASQAIMVKPQPMLTLDYFLAGDVYADDPFTNETEPAELFTLGVRIKNSGGGAANKLSIETAQPRIIENIQGLAIGFQIIQGYVQDMMADKTLMLNFGDIGPSMAKIGRWDMVTTLTGRFVDFSASFTHDNSLGGALTSLIKQVNTHLLVHDVKNDLAGRDSIRDFLALDGDVLRLYQSEGDNSDVTDYSSSATLTASSGGTYRLRFNAGGPGYAYVTLPDPNGGRIQPGRLTRSDGKLIPTENVWLSKKRNADTSIAHFINFFDVNSTGDYSQELIPAAQLSSIEGLVYLDANNNGRMDSGEATLGATRVDLTGTDSSGQAVSASGFSDMQGVYKFTQLRPGTYTLKVGAVTGYLDGTHTAGTAGGTVGSDTISNIVLGAAVNASGYRFAKRSAIPNQADLAINHSASSLTVLQNAETTVTVKLKNNGPAAALAASVSYPIPAGLTLTSATTTPPSVGTYSNGNWSVGDLTTGSEANLTLVLKAATYRDYTLTATASSTTPDPVSANNSQSLTLNAAAQNQSDVRVTATASVMRAPTGGAYRYTVEAANFGPDSASGLSVAITLPANATLIDASASAGTYNNGQWTIGSLANGQAAILTFNVTAADSQPATLSANVAALTSSDPNPANNSGTVTVNAAGAQADLALQLSANPANTNPGDSIELTYRLTNLGDDLATDLTVDAPLPTNLSYQSAAASNGNYNPATGRWTLPTLAKDATATLTLSVRADTNTATTVVAQASSALADPNPANNRAQTSLNTTPLQADLSIRQSADHTRLVQGETLRITLTARNSGPATAAQVTVTDRLPTGFALNTATPSQGNYNPADGTWAIGTLAASGEATLTLEATVTLADTLENSAQISSATLDPNLADNQSRLTFAVAEADIALSQSVDKPSINVGETVTYTVRVTNNGPDTAQGLVINDRLPAAFQLAQASASQGSYDPASGDWQIGLLPVGDTVTLTLTGTIQAGGAHTNTASVKTARLPDRNPANNSVSTTVNAIVQADLSLNLSGPAVANAGSTLTYTLTVTNSGPGAADGAQLSILLPGAYSGIQASCQITQGTQGAATCPTALNNPGDLAAIPLANLPAGSSLQLTLRATAPAGGSHTLSANISAPTGIADPNPANNSVSQSTLIKAATATTLSADPTTAYLGETITLVARVSAGDNSPATGNISFREGATILATRPLDSSGQASYTLNTLSLGSHNLTADYEGDDNHQPSTTAAATNIDIRPIPQPQLSLSATSLDFGAQTIGTSGAAQTITVTNQGPGVLNLSAVNLSAITISGQQAGDYALSGTCNTTASPATSLTTGQNCTLILTFTPTGAGQRSASLDISSNDPVSPAHISLSGIGLIPVTDTSTALTVSATNLYNDQPLTLTAQITGAAGSGSVTFKDGAAALGSIALGADGRASLTVASLSAGSHSLTATYSGDATHRTSTSAAVTVTVVAPAAPTVSLTAPTNNATYLAPASLTISATAATTNTGGSIAKVEFFAGSTLIGTATSAPYSVTWMNVAAGNHTLTAKATDDRGLSSTSAAVSIGTLSGSLNIVPTSARVGQTLTLNSTTTATVTLNNVPLKLRITNPTTGATLNQWTTSANLTANNAYLWSNTWDSSGQAAGSYRAILSESINGSDHTLAQTDFTLTAEPAGTGIELSARNLLDSRVLVLATCNTANGNNDSVDAVCAAARKTYLDTLLTQQGITHKIVTDADTFRNELRCGNWNTTWLAGGTEKLKDRLIDELAEQTYAGKGIIVDGINDSRNKALEDILGVSYKGKQNNQSHTLVTLDNLLPYSNGTVAGRALKLQPETSTAQTLARFDSTSGDPAIIAAPYGAGQALTLGYDLIGTQQTDPAAEANLIPLLSRITPAGTEPNGIAKTKLTVRNSSTASVSLQVSAQLPAGVSLDSSQPAQQNGVWAITLAAGASVDISANYKMPNTAGDITLRYDLLDNSGAVIGSQSLTVSVIARSGGTADALITALNALTVSGSDKSARDKAVQKVTEAKNSQSSNAEAALYSLLDASTEIDKLSNPGNLPQQLAQLAVSVSQTICQQQLPLCLRPEQGSPTLSSYNVLLFGNGQFSNGSAEGAIGVGGSAQYSNYSAASQIMGDAARVLAGGSLSYNNGSVGKSNSGVILSGGSLNVSPNVGRRLAQGNTTTDDWLGLKNQFTALADSLTQKPAIPATFDGFGKTTLKGSDPDINHFTLTGTQLTATRNLVIDVPNTSATQKPTVIITVTGSSASFQNGQAVLLQNGAQQSLQGHPFANYILFNLSQATSLTVSGWSIQGTVLAPRASVSYANGNLYGQIIANTLNTSSTGFQQCGIFKGVLPR